MQATRAVQVGASLPNSDNLLTRGTEPDPLRRRRLLFIVVHVLVFVVVVSLDEPAPQLHQRPRCERVVFPPRTLEPALCDETAE